MPFRSERTIFPEIIRIKPEIFSDERGYFLESFKRSDYRDLGITEVFVQSNFAFSHKHVLRGMHFQRAPYAQSKLVQCLEGSIFDVVVDIRTDSPSFGDWMGVELSGKVKDILYVPAGFAHGYLVLSDLALVHYKTSKEYEPTRESGFIWNDPDVGIEWPVDIVLLSEKDKNLPPFKQVRSIV